jgi:hypothetical protein
MKWWNSAFNAQVSGGIIVAVQVGAVKIYVAAVEALRKKERQGETQETIKNDCFMSFKTPRPSWVLMYFFAGFFLNLTLCMTKLEVLTLSFPDFKDISILWNTCDKVMFLNIVWNNKIFMKKSKYTLRI